jgi:hypothetical protein
LTDRLNDQNLNPAPNSPLSIVYSHRYIFSHGDPISVHTLAGAAREILEGLCRLEGIEPMTDFILKDHPRKSRKDIWNAMNL